MKRKKIYLTIVLLIVFILAVYYFSSDRRKIIINNFIPEQNSQHTAYADGSYYYYDEIPGFSGIRKLKDGHTKNLLKTKGISCISATKDYVYFVADSILYQATKEGEIVAEVEMDNKYEYISMTSKTDDLWISGIVRDDVIGVDEGIISICSLEDIRNNRKIKFNDEYEIKKEIVEEKNSYDRIQDYYGIENYYLNQKSKCIYLKKDAQKESGKTEYHQKGTMTVSYEYMKNILCCYDKQTGNKLLNVPDSALAVKDDSVLNFNSFSYYSIRDGKINEIMLHEFFAREEANPWCMAQDYYPTIKLDGDNVVMIRQRNKIHQFPGASGASPEPDEKLKDHIQDGVVLMGVKDGKQKEDFRTKQGEKILYADSGKVLTFYNDAYRLYDYDKNMLKKIDSKKYGKSGNYYAELCKDIVFIYKNNKVIDKIEL